MASTRSGSGGSSTISSTPPEKPPETAAKAPILNSQLSSYFIAGGCAGAASRTVVSPLERLKIIQQVQPREGGNPYKGVWRSLGRMWAEEGFTGFMRGNGINCVRIIPYSAVQFTAYETFKKLFSNDGARQLDTPTRLLAGALAGICSVSATYPLDLCRARLSIASATILTMGPTPTTHPLTTARPSLALVDPSIKTAMSTLAVSTSRPRIPGMWGMMAKVFREEGGVRALYRGIVPTAVGVAPYVGINFAAYERLRGIFTPPGQDNPAWRKLSCGALAGSISQTITYPFDVLRRKMQVSGMSSLGPGYNNAFDAIRGMFQTEGIRGFYRGLWPNLLKVAPSIATSFYTYELVKEYLTEAHPHL